MLRSLIFANTLFFALAANAASTGLEKRGGLPNFMSRMNTGEQKMVVYFGGTATANGDLTSRLNRTLGKGYKKPAVRIRNMGIDGTGSWLGAFRVGKDTNHYVPVGLVVAEFAADDALEPPERIQKAWEGSIRRILVNRWNPDILILHIPRPEWLADYRNGKIPTTVATIEALAAHYQLSSLDLGAWLVNQDGIDPRTLWDKTGKPTTKLNQLAAQALDELLSTIRNDQAPQKPLKRKLPPRLAPSPLEKGSKITYEHADLEPGWLGWQESPVARYLHVVRSQDPKAIMTYRFQGSSIGLLAPFGADSAGFQTSLDGADWQQHPAPKISSGWAIRSVFVADRLDPQKTHELRVRGGTDLSPGKMSRLAFFLVDGKSVYNNPMQGKSVIEQLDALYADMEPVRYQAPANRWQHLPKTMKLLQDGPTLTIVMLGDSIVNDTSNSRYEHLLMRLYPKCKIKKVTSVRGSTGSWWYKDDNRMDNYVIKHKPNLLIIGGISQRGDLDSIRETIKQARAKLPELEVILMTGAFGRSKPKQEESWQIETGIEGDGYRAKLKRLAQEEGCEFLDLRGAWGQYIRDSNRAMGSFKRDPIHANDRGKQILGRIIERYFTPKKR